MGLVKHYPAETSEVEKNVTEITTRDLYLFDYLTGLSDPENKVNDVLKNTGYTNIETFNFEGVGLIYHFQKS